MCDILVHYQTTCIFINDRILHYIIIIEISSSSQFFVIYHLALTYAVFVLERIIYYSISAFYVGCVTLNVYDIVYLLFL